MSFTLAIYGDSISTGTHGGGGWAPAAATAGACPIHNHAVGSSPMAAVAPNSLVEVLADPTHLHPDADAIVVWHASNDWYWGSPLGDVTSSCPTTFHGALRHTITLLHDTAPHAQILVPTPLWRYEQPAGTTIKAGPAATTANRHGLVLGDYERVLRDQAIALDYTIVDTGPSGIGPDTAETYLEDQVHPNAAGYRRIAPLLVEAICTVTSHG